MAENKHEGTPEVNPGSSQTPVGVSAEYHQLQLDQHEPESVDARQARLEREAEGSN